jgi:hypothetical protein
MLDLEPLDLYGGIPFKGLSNFYANVGGLIFDYKLKYI